MYRLANILQNTGAETFLKHKYSECLSRVVHTVLIQTILDLAEVGSDIEQEPSLIENNSSSLSITLISFNEDILKSMTENVYDWLIFLKINLDNNVKDYFNQNINSIELVSEQTGEFFTIYLGKDVLEYSEEEIQRIILQQTERIK